MINYKQEVLNIYPDAECRKIWNWYAIYWRDRKLSEYCIISTDAWESAYNRLNKVNL